MTTLQSLRNRKITARIEESYPRRYYHATLDRMFNNIENEGSRVEGLTICITYRRANGSKGIRFDSSAEDILHHVGALEFLKSDLMNHAHRVLVEPNDQLVEFIPNYGWEAPPSPEDE